MSFKYKTKKDLFGTEKISWKDIKNRIKIINPYFYQLIQEANISENHNLYILSFPYGSIVGDETNQYIPTINGQLIPLDSISLPKELIQDLEYGIGKAPLGMYLEKNFEWYTDYPDNNITVSSNLSSPGDFFSYGAIVKQNIKRNYIANSVYSFSAGARSSFIIPEIKCKNRHMKMCSELGIINKVPESQYDQFELFTKISNSKSAAWAAKILYFSNSWIESLKKSSNWFDIKVFFTNLLIEKQSYAASKSSLQASYYDAIKKSSLEVDSYMTELFSHIIDICMGESPGYIPATSEESLPLKSLQEAFIYNYRINKKVPTIMTPYHYNFESETKPIYYSLECKSAFSLLPKRKNNMSFIAEAKLVAGTFEKFKEHLISDKSRCRGTSVKDGLLKTNINFISIGGKESQKKQVSNDQRFSASLIPGIDSNYITSIDSNFFKSCIMLSRKN